MTPIEWLTIGLVVFAGVQVLIQYRDFRERRREHDRDEAKRIDQARTNLTFEWYRMRSIMQQWTALDLVTSIQVGQFDPDEILPHDRRSLVTDIARLGETSTFLVMDCLENADDAAKIAKRVVGMVKRFTQAELNELPNAENVETYQATVDQLVTTIRLLALEATNCLEDAIANSPGGTKPRLTEVKPNPVSQSAQKLLLAFEEQKRNSSGNKPLTKHSGK